MTVRELMSVPAKSCSEDTDLATAAKIMWDGDCGIVPVVDGDRRLVGVITDRDICIAAATRAAEPAALRVGEVMTRDVSTCAEHDTVLAALATLKERRIRRLPVTDRDARVVGLLSLSDLTAHATNRHNADVPVDEFLETLKAICSPAGSAVA